MGYLHIENLYKAQDILLFRHCFASEKVHGTSAHIAWTSGQSTKYFAGGCSQDHFESLFDRYLLLSRFEAKFLGSPVESVEVFGEAYGGKMQGMSHTYGPNLCFIVFDVKIGKSWLDMSKAEELAKELGFEFVPYRKISTDLSELDAQRDLPSEVAVRRGITEPKPREGIVLRPLIEVVKNGDERIIAKYKGEAFSERQHMPPVDGKALEVLRDADKIAEEWVTATRLQHVLDAHPDINGMEHTGELIRAMHEDIGREAKGEVELDRAALAAIGKRTVWFWKDRQKSKLTMK